MKGTGRPLLFPHGMSYFMVLEGEADLLLEVEVPFPLKHSLGRSWVMCDTLVLEGLVKLAH